MLPGRVLEDEGFRAPRPGERRVRNLAEFLKRIETDEVPFAQLHARLAGAEAEVRADREGYFRLEMQGLRLAGGWHEVKLRLADHPAVAATGRVLVPGSNARFAVVSDIDDTVLESHVTRKLRMLLTAALSNPCTRKPLPGVAALYRALHAGVNPFFYVSKSPWNLYVPLAEYLRLQRFPEGPLFLRNLGPRMDRQHKSSAIEALLGAYPRLPFVLVGDSGEDDPEVYAGIVRRHPRRIRAVYIRSVRPDPGRLQAIEALAREIAPTGCQLVLAAEAATAAAHAAAEGLIQASELRGIGAELAREAKSAARP